MIRLIGGNFNNQCHNPKFRSEFCAFGPKTQSKTEIRAIYRV